jgi:hypothetical protein
MSEEISPLESCANNLSIWSSEMYEKLDGVSSNLPRDTPDGERCGGAAAAMAGEAAAAAAIALGHASVVGCAWYSGLCGGPPELAGGVAGVGLPARGGGGFISVGEDGGWDSSRSLWAREIALSLFSGCVLVVSRGEDTGRRVE